MKVHEDCMHQILKQTARTHEAQAVFKNWYSCEGRIFVLNVLFHWTLSIKRQHLHIMLIVFSSFFESVHHEHLAEKMLRSKIHLQFVRMFQWFYKRAQSLFLLKKQFSWCHAYTTGLRQVSKWSQDLVAFFVNDIIIILEQSAASLHIDSWKKKNIFYADDLIIFETDPVVMQHLLDLLCSECFRIDLQINVEKTIHNIVSSRSSCYPISIHCNGEFAPFASDLFLYIGCRFSTCASMNVHIEATWDAAMRAFETILNIWKRCPFLTLIFKLEMLNILARSVPNFISSVSI